MACVFTERVEAWGNLSPAGILKKIINMAVKTVPL